MPEGDLDGDAVDTARQQKQRTFLRERFLRFLIAMRSRPGEFLLHNDRTVRGKFEACDVDVLHLQVSDLDTPLGRHTSALLRTTDVVAVTMPVHEN